MQGYDYLIRDSWLEPVRLLLKNKVGNLFQPIMAGQKLLNKLIEPTRGIGPSVYYALRASFQFKMWS